MNQPFRTRSLAVDRKINSLVNRRAYEIAHQLIPSIKAYLLAQLRFEQDRADECTKIDVNGEEFAFDVVSLVSAEEVLYDIKANI